MIYEIYDLNVSTIYTRPLLIGSSFLYMYIHSLACTNMIQKTFNYNYVRKLGLLFFVSSENP